MVLSDDQFQAYVEENDVGKKKCKFCGHLFAFHTSISRIKWHWSGTKGHGAAICREVPKDVQEAAFLATEGVNKKCRIRADWLINVDNKTDRLVKTVAEASSSGGHTPNKSDARENALPTSPSELAGKAFEENKNAILSWLMNDEVLRIGIYGMGGVGKTSLVKHVYNQLRKTSGTFHHVYWITIPQDFSIYKLQNLIARCLGIHLSNEDDEILRAQELSEAFVMKWQPFLILDNLWDTFDPEKVGIPVQEKGCKLILTTRSLKVCRGMGCLQKIKVEPLPWEEAWTLFRDRFTHDVVMSPEVEQIAKSVTRKCAGLPLGIITMAESMRGVSDLHEWRNTLEKLKKSKVRDMKDKVFPSLRFSYDQLDDLAQQQCFLYCALFPEDYGISREDLIGYFIDEGIIEGIDSRQAEFDEGHAILNELENVCLLESCDDYNGYRAVRMHGLIRDLACQILRMSSPIMVKSHFAGVKRRGVNICTKAPKEIQEASYLAIHGSRKKLETMPSEVANKFSASSLEEKNEIEILERDIVENKSPAEVIQFVETGSSVEGNVADVRETGGTALPRMDLGGQSIEKDWQEIYDSSKENDDLNCSREDMAGDLIQEGLHETRGDALLTTEPVGQAFQRNTDEIWSFLKKEQVFTIGVCGGGGMGKTTLVMHIRNLLLKIPNSFHHIYWITVTQDFSIYKLQNLIAKSIDLDLSNEKDEKSRAAKLSKAFLTKQKSVLILDDLRNHFNAEKVGIPIRGNKCKLIFTTRSLDVCKWMGCPEYMVIVEPLSEEEAWSLFAKELGNYDVKVGHLAKFLSSECAGFPLGIKTTARSMRGVEDVYAWRKTLQELEELKSRKAGSMELDVFPILEFSYLHLNDLSLQRCLLYCALFPEDCKINKNDLIEHLIAEGIIEARGSRQSQFDKGHFMLDKLENACLLESFITEDYGYVRMHDLIRDMALQIMNSRAMVKAGVHLKEFPDEEKWTEGLVHVSLMRNDIEEVPPNLSPRCTNLATLLLCGNHKLELITDSFVKRLCLLQFLDLSFTAIKELPGSISGLVHLDGLWLRGCYKLRHVPSLAKLRKLKMLNFSNAPLEEVPHGIDLLFKLRYLNLDGTAIKEFSATMLFNLSNLQFLHLNQSLGGLRAVEVEGVAGLRKLESLKCHFYDLVDFNKYLKSQEERQPLCTYDIKIGQLGDNVFTDFMLPPISKKDTNKEVRLYNCNIGERGDFLALPEGIQKLVIAKCHDARNLCNVQATGLKSFVISECHGVEFLFTLSSFSTDIVKSVETLHLYWLKNLIALFGREGTASQPFPSIGTFSCLRVFDVFNCPSIKTLFPSGLLPNLKHLEVIEVGFCDKMEEIIAAEEEDEGGIVREERNSSSRSIDASVEFRLPNLRLLKLRNLSELKSICSGVMICDSLQELDIVYCLKLKRLPFSRALPKSIRKIQSYPKEWWELVEGDKRSAKNIHQPPP